LTSLLQSDHFHRCQKRVAPILCNEIGKSAHLNLCWWHAKNAQTFFTCHLPHFQTSHLQPAVPFFGQCFWTNTFPRAQQHFILLTGVYCYDTVTSYSPPPSYPILLQARVVRSPLVSPAASLPVPRFPSVLAGCIFSIFAKKWKKSENRSNH
jgi:hypothetical protein